MCESLCPNIINRIGFRCVESTAYYRWHTQELLTQINGETGQCRYHQRQNKTFINERNRTLLKMILGYLSYMNVFIFHFIFYLFFIHTQH